MNKLKGKSTFSMSEIEAIKKLIIARIAMPPNMQKGIRQKMRDIGFYGRDDWGINDCQISDLENLIKSGQIKVSNSFNINKIERPISNKEERLSQIFVPKTIQIDNDELLESIKQIHFDPKIHAVTNIPDGPGNYIYFLCKNSLLPIINIVPILTKFDGFQVIYTGISSKSLRNRDYNQHFNGHAGRSTLRKSLGVLFGYKQIPRDKGSDSGKTKFAECDEHLLSDWMKNNLVMFILPTQDYENTEHQLIQCLNPPFNLKGTNNIINADFRNYVKNLRKS